MELELNIQAIETLIIDGKAYGAVHLNPVVLSKEEYTKLIATEKDTHSFKVLVKPGL